MPANALVRLLNEEGFRNARAFISPDRQVRVMVGPFSDEQTLQQARASLEAAGFRLIGQW